MSHIIRTYILAAFFLRARIPTFIRFVEDDVLDLYSVFVINHFVLTFCVYDQSIVTDGFENANSIDTYIHARHHVMTHAQLLGIYIYIYMYVYLRRYII